MRVSVPRLPNVCPSCGTAPYPRTAPCETCGLKGDPDAWVADESVYSFRSVISTAFWLVVAVGLFLIVTLSLGG